MQLTIVLWPEIFWMKFPSGQRHCLMLSGEADANMYLKQSENSINFVPAKIRRISTHKVGWRTTLRTLFLWFVSVPRLFPAAKSHSRTVESWLPVIICGSLACVTTLATVFVWPTNVWMLALVRMSQTRAVESLPAETSTSIVGCNASEWTADKCPW